MKSLSSLFTKPVGKATEALSFLKNVGMGAAKGVGELATPHGYLVDLITKGKKFESKITPEQVQKDKEKLSPQGGVQKVAHAIGSLSPGMELVKPGLEKAGVDPRLAMGIALGIDVLTPGPGEIKSGKALKEVKGLKATEDLSQISKQTSLLPTKEVPARAGGGIKPPGKPPLPPKEKVISSLSDDIPRLKDGQIINVNRLNISDEGKMVVSREAETLVPRMSQKVGKTLTNKEVIQYADNTSKVLESAVGREQTLKYNAQMLNLRRRIATAAESGKVSREFLEDLVVDKSVSADIARALQSRAIGADPNLVTGQRAMLEAVLDVNKNIDEILEASKGVNFNDAKQATEFYRKFIAPRLSEWVDLLRYNSMLSSPLTHAKNIFSNILNSTVRPVLTKAVTGGLDLLDSKVHSRVQQQFAREGAVYVEGYIKNFQEATQRFKEVMSDTRAFTNLDLRHVPLTTSGKKKALEQTLRFPMKVLEATDQFFSALSEGGEIASFKFRESKIGKISNIDELVTDAAQYGLFRQGLHAQGQGPVLDFVDSVVSLIEQARHSKNIILSQIAKITLPFLRTPTNIIKQGIEYSPLGVTTIPGASNKAEQFAKAIIGTSFSVAAGIMLTSNRMTWGEPKTTKEKNAFRENGMQPYSIKFGDKWYSYQYLAPFMSFPLAFVAMIHDTVKSKKIDDDLADTILSAFSKYGNFYADQSYLKSIGDLFNAIGGDEYAISKLLSNPPQQFVPFRALSGWIARLTDDLQRVVDKDANFIEKQVQLLMMNVPVLSQKLEPRKGPRTKQPIKNENRVINAISPIRIQTQTERQSRSEAARQKKKRRGSSKNFKSLGTVL